MRSFTGAWIVVFAYLSQMAWVKGMRTQSAPLIRKKDLGGDEDADFGRAHTDIIGEFKHKKDYPRDPYGDHTGMEALKEIQYTPGGRARMAPGSPASMSTDSTRDSPRFERAYTDTYPKVEPQMLSRAESAPLLRRQPRPHYERQPRKDYPGEPYGGRTGMEAFKETGYTPGQSGRAGRAPESPISMSTDSTPEIPTFERAQTETYQGPKPQELSRAETAPLLGHKPRSYYERQPKDYPGEPYGDRVGRQGMQEIISPKHRSERAQTYRDRAQSQPIIRDYDREEQGQRRQSLP